MKENIIKPKIIKIGFLGDSRVGKGIMGNCYLGEEFQDDFILYPIRRNNLETKFKLKNGEEIKLKFIQTSGDERFKSVDMHTLRSYRVQGIILIFDVTNKSSFEHLYTWLMEIKENLNDPIFVLFANKVDIDKSYWEVTIEEAQQFAEKMQIPLFETSSKTRQGIMEGLSYIVNEIYDKKFVENNDNILIDNRYRRTNNNTGCIINKKIKNFQDNKNKKK